MSVAATVPALPGHQKPRRVTTVEARKNFSDLVNRSAYGKEQVILTRRGRPIAAIVPVEDRATESPRHPQSGPTSDDEQSSKVKPKMRSTLRDALDFVERLESFGEMHAAWKAFLDYTSQFGFTNGALADMPGPSERLQDTVLCLSWPNEWRKRYLERDYIRDDPARLHLSRSVEPYSWEELTASEAYTPEQKNIIYEASDFGMKSGIVFPMPGLRAGPAMLTIAGENNSVSEDDQTRLHLAAMYTHAVVRKLSGKRSGGAASPTFSRRERECLQWYAAGKSEWEIGEILSLAEKTVNTCLERAKQKFGVSTRKQAIVAALRSGVIQY